jgi:PHAX RNA-binding domain
MRTKAGDRRRTPGGVFFQLVKQHATTRERHRLFPRPASQHGQGQPQPPTVLTWEEASTLMQTLTIELPGEARTMKLTLIGRPGKVETRGQAVVFHMQGKPPASLPRGLPPVPSTPGMTWNVMVALRQWNRVKDSLAANQEDQLIIEGYPLMQGNQHVLLAQSCTKYQDISFSMKFYWILIGSLCYFEYCLLRYPNELWSNRCGVSRPNEVCHPLERCRN